jgi:hypothetical protein
VVHPTQLSPFNEAGQSRRAIDKTALAALLMVYKAAIAAGFYSDQLASNDGEE